MTADRERSSLPCMALTNPMPSTMGQLRSRIEGEERRAGVGLVLGIVISELAIRLHRGLYARTGPSTPRAVNVDKAKRHPAGYVTRRREVTEWCPLDASALQGAPGDRETPP